MSGKNYFTSIAPKQVKELFSAKVEVTEKDAKKINPLVKFWNGKMDKAFKLGLANGIIIGGILFGLLFMLLTEFSR